MDNSLGIMALFRNESGALEEWILHHIDQGIDHFYLIDNASDDDFIPIIEKYNDIITMIEQPKIANQGEKFDQDTRGVQEDSYMMMLPYVKTEWLMIIDLDEFIYTRNGYYNVKELLEKEGKKFDQLMFKLKLFNSNNQVKQPESIINGFTSRVDVDRFVNPLPKVVTRTKKIKYITAHFCYLNDEESLTVNDNLQKSTKIYGKDGVLKIEIMDYRNDFTVCKEDGYIDSYIIGNHYPVQSEEWFYNVKAKRGICGWAGSEFHETAKYFDTYYKKLNNRRCKDDFELKELSKRWKII